MTMTLRDQIQQHARFAFLVERLNGRDDERPTVATVPAGTYNN